MRGGFRPGIPGSIIPQSPGTFQWRTYELGFILADFKKTYLSLPLIFHRPFSWNASAVPHCSLHYSSQNLCSKSWKVFFYYVCGHSFCSLASPCLLSACFTRFSAPSFLSPSLTPPSLLDKVCSIAQAGLKFLILLLWAPNCEADRNVRPGSEASFVSIPVRNVIFYFFLQFFISAAKGRYLLPPKTSWDLSHFALSMLERVCLLPHREKRVILFWYIVKWGQTC